MRKHALVLIVPYKFFSRRIPSEQNEGRALSCHHREDDDGVGEEGGGRTRIKRRIKGFQGQMNESIKGTR
ncbi:hypothetical protein PSENEW3_00000077 [Picochlorum sp. SENEW3]|nr:hypothetical protein PSENEW3_00000077 [Picochlorum sp. SENEW3]